MLYQFARCKSDPCDGGHIEKFSGLLEKGCQPHPPPSPHAVGKTRPRFPSWAGLILPREALAAVPLSCPFAAGRLCAAPRRHRTTHSLNPNGESIN